MKRITFDFDLLIHDTNTLTQSYSFTPELLSIRVLYVALQVGEGEEIRVIDIPEATLLFKNVSFSEREVVIWDNGTKKFETLSTEKDPLPEVPEDPNPGVTLFWNSIPASGLVAWKIKAAAFGMEIEDDLYEKLNQAGFAMRAF